MSTKRKKSKKPRPANVNNAVQTVKASAAKPRTQERIETGIEGVTISGSPEIAGAGIRVIAIVYDGMLILALLFILGLVLTVVGTLLTQDVGVTSEEAQTLPVWYQNLVMTPAFVLTLIGFYGLFWRRSGQTLGMQTWRLKTVTNSGELLTWGDSIKRILGACMMPVLCGLAGYIIHESREAILASAFFGLTFNYLFCLLNRKGASVQDLLSNTITLKMPKIHHESLFKSLKRK